MKHHSLFLAALPFVALASCGKASSQETYDVSWLSPTGIPALAFYDQGNNDHWQSYAAATSIAPAFATDEVDAIVFDGYAGLKNVLTNNRNYVLARWISGGTFYLVSTKHASLEEYQSGQTVDAFVKTGNAAQAFLSLATEDWQWGENLASDPVITWETGVAEVKNHLENSWDSYDWYLVAQPVLFASTNVLKQKGVTLNVVANLQEEWAAFHDGAKIPAAGLFVNKTRYAEHKGAIDAFLAETDKRIEKAIDEPAKVVKALNAFGEEKTLAKFGYKPAIVNALQSGGKNQFGLIKDKELPSLADVAKSFAEALGENIAFPESLFLR